MAPRICGYKISRDGAIASSFLVSLFLIVIIIYYSTKSHSTSGSGLSTTTSASDSSTTSPGSGLSTISSTGLPTKPSTGLPTTPSAPGCEIDPLQLDAPLLLISGTSNFTYPNHGDKLVKSQSDKAIDFACPGGSVMVNGNKLASVVTATCVKDQEFEIQKGTYHWNQISCSGTVYASSKKSGNKCEGGEEILVGFDLGSGRFAVVMTVCFNEKQEIALYSQFEMTSSIGIAQYPSKTPSFYQDKEFYTVSKVDGYYIRTKQRETINTLLGLGSTSTKYIKDNSDKRYFLSRGHLAARADFLYVAQQNATYRFLNVAPQWQTLNGFNWEKAERSTRSYAYNNNVDLQIWTGTFKISTLPHDTNKKPIDLYLYTENDAELLPVPAFFWKIVYNPENEKGIVLVSFNNPYKTETEVKKEIFCNDIADKVSWLTWNKSSLEDGYSFACTLTEFQKIVNVAPKLKDNGLLL